MLSSLCFAFLCKSFSSGCAIDNKYFNTFLRAVRIYVVVFRRPEIYRNSAADFPVFKGKCLPARASGNRGNVLGFHACLTLSISIGKLSFSFGDLLENSYVFTTTSPSWTKVSIQYGKALSWPSCTYHNQGFLTYLWMKFSIDLVRADTVLLQNLRSRNAAQDICTLLGDPPVFSSTILLMKQIFHEPGHFVHSGMRYAIKMLINRIAQKAIKSMTQLRTKNHTKDLTFD